MDYRVIIFVVQFVNILIEILSYSILIRIVVSWFRSGNMSRGQNVFMQFIYDISEPILRLARSVPHSYKMMDFSPIIALLALDLIRFIFNYLIF